MKKQELIRRIKAGASCYAQIKTFGGKDWQYVKIDTESFLQDLEDDPKMTGIVVREMAKTLWFDVIDEEFDE